MHASTVEVYKGFSSCLQPLVAADTPNPKSLRFTPQEWVHEGTHEAVTRLCFPVYGSSNCDGNEDAVGDGFVAC